MFRVSVSQPILAATLVLIIVGPRAGAAEESAQASRGVALEEVLVTAQKRAEDITTVPISISSVSQDTLDQQGAKNIADLARLVPGVNVNQATAGETNISIRGIGTTVGAATTGVYINDTPVQARYICFYCGFTAFPQLFDLERVEVLRGPQGTLFGSGSEGGTIRFITPAPSLTQYSLYSRSEVGFKDHGAPNWELGVAGGGPVVDGKAGFRASLWTRTDGGYIDHVAYPTGTLLDKNANSAKDYVARVSFLFAPADALQITPSFFYQRTHHDSRDSWWEGAGLFNAFSWVPDPVTDRQGLTSLDINYDVGSFTIKSITSYYDRTETRVDDYTPIEASVYQGGPFTVPGLPGYTAANYMKTRQKNFTEELRFASEDDSSRRFSWVGGLYYSHARIAFAQATQQDFESLIEALYGASVVDVFGVPAGQFSYLENTSNLEEEFAGFGQASYLFTNRLKLAVGLRVARTKFSDDVHQDGPEAGGLVVSHGDQQETPVTPKASLSYQGDDYLLYASAGKGYRIGGANTSVAVHSICQPDLQLFGIADAPKTYHSDSVWSYEIGEKMRLLDRRVELSGSLFWINWKGIQQNVLLPTCLYNYTANLGSAVSRGFDFQGQILVLPGWTVSGSVGYTDAYYNQTVSPGGKQVLVADGQKFVLPPWNALMSTRYSWAIGNRAGMYARADYSFTSGYDTSQPDLAGYDPLAHRLDDVRNLALRLGLVYGGLDLSVFANNALNARPLIGHGRDSPSEDPVAMRDTTLTPRTIGLTATYRY